MTPDSPNAIKAERTLFARLCYFMIGCVLGAVLTLKFIYYLDIFDRRTSALVCGLLILACGLLGFFSSRRTRKNPGILDILDI
jgi:hypothetical protein